MEEEGDTGEGKVGMQGRCINQARMAPPMGGGATSSHLMRGENMVFSLPELVWFLNGFNRTFSN